MYNIHVVCAYGGGSLYEQSKACEDGAEIIVATPVSTHVTHNAHALIANQTVVSGHFPGSLGLADCNVDVIFA